MSHVIWSLQIGEFTIGPAYSLEENRVSIHRASGEGGDFDAAALEEVIAKFYEERF